MEGRRWDSDDGFGGEKRKILKNDFFLTVPGVVENGFEYFNTSKLPLKSYKIDYLVTVYEELYYHYLSKLSKLNQDFILTKTHIDNINDIIKYYEDEEDYKRCSLLKTSLDNKQDERS